MQINPPPALCLLSQRSVQCLNVTTTFSLDELQNPLVVTHVPLQKVNDNFGNVFVADITTARVAPDDCLQQDGLVPQFSGC